MWIKIKLKVAADFDAASVAETQRICVDFSAGAACDRSSQTGSVSSMGLNDVKFVRNPLLPTATPVRLIKSISAE